MNNEHKKKLQAAQKRLDDLRGDVGTVLAVIQDIFNAEEETYEKMSDSVKESEKGQKLEAAKEALEAVVSALEEIDDEFSTADDNLTTVLE